MNTNYNNNQFVPGQLENMYPEVYNDLRPFITESANELLRSGHMPTPESISASIDNIIKRSGMWDEDENNSPAQYANARPFRQPRRRHHNRNTLRDITRILLLQELLGNCCF